MPAITTTQYTMSIKRLKVNGVKKVITTIYENGKEIYRDSHTKPGRNEVYAQNFIQAMRMNATRQVLVQLERISPSF